MSESTNTQPIDAAGAATLVLGDGIVVHRKPLTVVISAAGDEASIAPLATDLVDDLVALGEWEFGPVAQALQDLVVAHQPAGVAALLDARPDPIIFLFDRAHAIENDQTHSGRGRAGWNTVFATADEVSLYVGAIDAIHSDPSDGWAQLSAGTVAGIGATTEVLTFADWGDGEPAIRPIEEQENPDDEFAPIDTELADTESVDLATVDAEPVDTALGGEVVDAGVAHELAEHADELEANEPADQSSPAAEPIIAAAAAAGVAGMAATTFGSDDSVFDEHVHEDSVLEEVAGDAPEEVADQIVEDGPSQDMANGFESVGARSTEAADSLSGPLPTEDLSAVQPPLPDGSFTDTPPPPTGEPLVTASPDYSVAPPGLGDLRPTSDLPPPSGSPLPPPPSGPPISNEPGPMPVAQSPISDLSPAASPFGTPFDPPADPPLDPPTASPFDPQADPPTDASPEPVVEHEPTEANFSGGSTGGVPQLSETEENPGVSIWDAPTTQQPLPDLDALLDNLPASDDPPVSDAPPLSETPPMPDPPVSDNSPLSDTPPMPGERPLDGPTLLPSEPPAGGPSPVEDVAPIADTPPMPDAPPLVSTPPAPVAQTFADGSSPDETMIMPGTPPTPDSSLISSPAVSTPTSPLPEDGPTSGLPPLPDTPPMPAASPIDGTPPLPNNPLPSTAVVDSPFPNTPIAGSPPIPGTPPLPDTPPLPGTPPLPDTPPMPDSQHTPGTPPMPDTPPIPDASPRPGGEPLPGTPPLPGGGPIQGTPPPPSAADLLAETPPLPDPSSLLPEDE